MTDEDIEDVAHWRGDKGLLVATLVDEKWLERTEDDELKVHQWEEHQPYIYFSAERSEAQREKAFKGWKTKREKQKSDGAAEGVAEGGEKTDPKKPAKQAKGKDLEDIVPVKEIIEYLNAATGKNFSYTSQSTKRHVAARYRDGYGVEDFKKVIDHQCAKWVGKGILINGVPAEDYLRPETLFNETKFQGYLNAPATEGKNSKGTDTAGRPLEELPS
jgi:uncharacterized phage protein (TIGR02220 family)